MATTRKLQFQDLFTSASTYIGQSGSIFFDPTTTTLRFGDSITPGGITAPGFSIAQGNQTPVAGSLMKIDYLLENNSKKLQSEAGIWPTQTYTYFGVSKEFNTAATPATAAGSPLTTLFAYANNSGSNGDIVAGIFDAISTANNTTVFGSNIIVRSGGGGLTGQKLVGLEIDVEPANGDTVTSGAGLILNAFNVAMPNAPAIQIGGLGGGTFSNGLIVNGIAGSAFAAQTGASMTSFMNTANGTFSDQAIILGNNHRIKYTGISGFFAYQYVDTSGNWRLVPPGNGGFFVRTGTDAGNTFQIASNGQVIVGKGSAILTTDTQFQLLIPFTAGTPTGVPANNAGGIATQYDTTNQRPWFYDNGASKWIAGATVVSGQTASLGGGALAAGACATVTLSLTGATVGKVVQATPETYPGDGFYWVAYVSSANTVTVKVGATVAGTPTASVYDVRVIQ